MNTSQIPITRDLNLVYLLSLLTGLLMAGASLTGLLYPGWVYPTDELRTVFVANDVVNLIIGLPTLLSCMWFTRRGKLIGLLLWPGAFLYVLYNYLAYTIGIPFSGTSLAYLALTLVSAYSIYALLISIDKKSVQKQLERAAPVKTAGWILVVLGTLFALRAIGLIAQAITSQTALPAPEFSVLVADLALSTLLVTGGVLLLRRRPLGYVSGLGLLFAASTLFAGLIIFLLLQPLLSNAPLVLTDVIVVLLMGMICFIPFVQFARGIVTKRSIS